jgi:hypothetical protein
MLMELISSSGGISMLNLAARGLHTIDREGDCLGRDRKEEIEERQLKSFKVEERFERFSNFDAVSLSYLCWGIGCVSSGVAIELANYSRSHFPALFLLRFLSQLIFASRD